MSAASLVPVRFCVVDRRCLIGPRRQAQQVRMCVRLLASPGRIDYEVFRIIRDDSRCGTKSPARSCRRWGSTWRRARRSTARPTRMCWMTDGIEMDTHTGGGFFAGLKRSFSGGSFFITDFTAHGAGHVAFAPRFPGTILPVAARRRPVADLPQGDVPVRREVGDAGDRLAAADRRRLLRRRGLHPAEGDRPGHGVPRPLGRGGERDLAPGERLLVHAGHVGVHRPDRRLRHPDGAAASATSCSAARACSWRP